MRLTLLVMLLLAPLAQAEDLPGAARQQELLHLLRHDCGSCHGMTLQGGLGPALTPARLAGRSPQALQQTILQGRAGTPMPPWQGLLTPQEVAWLVLGLQRGQWQ